MNKFFFYYFENPWYVANHRQYNPNSMTLKTCPHEEYTSIYHKNPLQHSASVRPLLVLIPGNPGLVDFYITYLNLIQKRNPNLEILCISHAGFKSDGNIIDDDSVFTYYNLEFQIEHKIDILKYFILNENRNTELYFLSHSVGSYINQRVVHRLLNNSELQNKMDIKFLGLICPTIIDIGRSNSGQIITKMFAYLPIIQIAIYLSVLINSLFPESFVKFVVKNVVIDKSSSTREESQESIENSTIGALKIFRSKNIIKQALNLAKEEMKTILKDDEFNDWFFKGLPSQYDIRIWAYFAHTDHWVHDTTKDYILARYHSDSNKKLSFEIGDIEDSITHSFCVNESIEFSQITSEKLSDLLP